MSSSVHAATNTVIVLDRLSQETCDRELKPLFAECREMTKELCAKLDAMCASTEKYAKDLQVE